MPRLPLRGAPAEYTIGVRITAEERRKLRALAKINCMTLGGLVAEAVAEIAENVGETAPLTVRVRSCASCPFCTTVPAD